MTVVEVVDDFGWPVPVESAVVTQWPMLVEDLAAGLVAVRFDPGTGVLSLRGTSPAWATLGRFRSMKIAQTVNQALGQQFVREIAILPPAHRSASPLPVLPPLDRACAGGRGPTAYWMLQRCGCEGLAGQAKTFS
ncbi:DciA family protein [Streptomyces sp. NPDC051286]|uniref:DciA family protein n=1 Tax=Streptomyces sp. NPDC051286 TaxID=3365647 RepID=UPI003796AF5F